MSEVSYIKLSELTKRVVDVIKNTFNDYYWIVAEISGHKFYANQDRHYFDFIEKVEEKTDPIAKISGVAWTSGSQQIKLFEEATGQQFTNGVQPSNALGHDPCYYNICRVYVDSLEFRSTL